MEKLAISLPLFIPHRKWFWFEDTFLPLFTPPRKCPKLATFLPLFSQPSKFDAKNCTVSCVYEMIAKWIFANRKASQRPPKCYKRHCYRRQNKISLDNDIYFMKSIHCQRELKISGTYLDSPRGHCVVELAHEGLRVLEDTKVRHYH